MPKQADKLPEPQRVRRELDAIAVSVANSAQIILSLNSAGNLIAEMPGIGSAIRRKINLPTNFLKHNPELATILWDEVSRLTALRKQQASAQKATYVDPEVARHERNLAIAKQKAEQFTKWLDSLPRERRELEIKKRDERLAKAKAAELERAHNIYNYTASTYPNGIDLANKVIPPERRPRRKVIVIGANGDRKEVSPRTGIETKNGRKPANPNMGVDL